MLNEFEKWKLLNLESTIELWEYACTCICMNILKIEKYCLIILYNLYKLRNIRTFCKCLSGKLQRLPICKLLTNLLDRTRSVWWTLPISLFNSWFDYIQNCLDENKCILIEIDFVFRSQFSFELNLVLVAAQKVCFVPFRFRHIDRSTSNSSDSNTEMQQ